MPVPPSRKAELCFTILGEPPLKMLRHQQQFSFYDSAKLDGAIDFVNLSLEVVERLDRALEAMIDEVERHNPALVVVDSFRSLVHAPPFPPASGQMDLTAFLQRLALDLTSRQVTTFLR